MNRTFLAISSGLTIACCLLACSSGGTTSGSGGSSSTSSSSSGTGSQMTPATSCVQPGGMGNDKGVGQYCSPMGHQCAGFMYASVCLADLAQDQWFCTHLSCTTDAECGTAAYCNKQSAGAACVPDKCGGAPDGGSEDAGDASSDGG